MKFADLHLHTLFSDGTFTPEELAGHGARLGFAAMALTDHDTVEGCARMAAACKAAGIEFIVGTELTAELDHTELHILGYFLDTQNQTLLTEIARFQAVRQQRIHEMVARINATGVPLTVESVFALANCKSPGRPHVARALVNNPSSIYKDCTRHRYAPPSMVTLWIFNARLSQAKAARQVRDNRRSSGSMRTVSSCTGGVSRFPAIVTFTDGFAFGIGSRSVPSGLRPVIIRGSPPTRNGSNTRSGLAALSKRRSKSFGR